MKVISKTVAEEIAIKLISSVNEKIKEKKSSLRTKVKELYDERVSDPYKDFISKIPVDLLRKTSHITLSSPSFKRSYLLDRDKSVYGDGYLEVSNDEIGVFISLQDEINHLEDEYGTLRHQVISTILKCRTAKRLEKEFPEAFQLAPKNLLSTSEVLALPLDQIKNSIQRLSK